MAERAAIVQLKADRSRLVAALEGAGAKIIGGKVARPFHPDAHPSGGVYEHDGAGWLYTCHGCRWNGDKNTGDVFDVVRRHYGCDFARACELLGLSNGRNPVAAGASRAQDARSGRGLTIDTPENEIDAPSPPQRDPGAMWATFPTVEAFVATLGGTHGGTWVYENPNSSPGMVVVRVNEADGGKRFVPLHPTADGWAIGDPQGPLPLYGLAELDGSGTVYVVEGEKCVEAGRSIGLTAITSSHDASSPGKSDWTPLAGRDVVILPDADKPGRLYAESVARILAGLHPLARMKIVELPGLPDGGDIADFIDAREGVDSTDIACGIESLVAAARWYTPTDTVPVNAAPTVDPWSGTSIGELLRAPKTWAPKTYIRTGLSLLDARLCGGFRTGGISLLCGKTGQGKTQLAVTIAGNAARAGTPVGFFSLELGREEIAQLVTAQRSGVPRLKLATGNLDASNAAALRKTIGECGDIPLTILDDDFWPGGLDRDWLTALVTEGVGRFGWRLVVLDYLGLLVPSEIDRDQYDTDLRHSAELKRLARKNDIALLVVGAVRKGATFRTIEQMTIDDALGAGRIAYDSQAVLGVGCVYGDADCGLVKARPFKMRFAPCDETAPPVRLRWRPCTGLITDLEATEDSA